VLTVFRLVQSYIRLEEKRFYGAFRVDSDGYWHLSSKPSEPVYVGKPSIEMDNHWTRLITRELSLTCLPFEYWAMTEPFYGHTAAEVKKLGLEADPDDYEPGLGYETPLFRTEPSTYHDLHCLVRVNDACSMFVWIVLLTRLQNYIRKALDWEYYTDIHVDRTTPEHPGHASHRLHLGESLRSFLRNFG
jgi:hypothetical protein